MTNFLLKSIAGFGQSKWVSEQLLDLARKDFSVPGVVCRMGSVSCSRKGAASSRTDLLIQIMDGMVETGSRPLQSFSLTFTPVDVIAESIVKLSLDPSTDGRNFHLIRRETISLTDLGDILESLRYALKAVDYSTWCAGLKAVPRLALLGQVLSSLPPSQDLWDTNFSCSEAHKLCSQFQGPYHCQPSNKTLIELMLIERIRRGMFLPNIKAGGNVEDD